MGAYIFTGTLSSAFAAPLLVILGLGLFFAACGQLASLDQVRAINKELSSTQDIDISKALEDVEGHREELTKSFELLTTKADKASQIQAKNEGRAEYNIYPALLAFVREKLSLGTDTTEFDLTSLDEIPEILHQDVVFSTNICPITQRPIRHIAFFQEDDQFYEKGALQERCLQEDGSSLTDTIQDVPARQALIDFRLKYLSNQLGKFARGTLDTDLTPVEFDFDPESIHGTYTDTPEYVRSLHNIAHCVSYTKALVGKREMHLDVYKVITVGLGVISAATLTLGVVYSMPALVILSLCASNLTYFSSRMNVFAEKILPTLNKFSDVRDIAWALKGYKRASHDIEWSVLSFNTAFDIADFRNQRRESEEIQAATLSILEEMNQSTQDTSEFVRSLTITMEESRENVQRADDVLAKARDISEELNAILPLLKERLRNAPETQ